MQHGRLASPRDTTTGMAAYIDRNPSRAAWIGLVCAFVLFLGTTFFAGRAGLSFIRSATRPATATLGVTLGPVLVQKAQTRGWVKAENGLVLGEGDAVENLGPGPPVTLAFFDGTVAVLQPGASLVLDEVRTGRFPIPGSPHRLLTFDLTGGQLHLDVTSADASGKVVVKAMGTRVTLAPGEFDLQIIRQQVDGIDQCCMTQFVDLHGTAQVYAAGETVTVRHDQRAVVPMGGVPLPLQPAARELVVNGALEADAHGSFPGWTIVRRSEPGGALGTVTPLAGADGPGIHIVRTGSDVHGETGLLQNVNLDARNLVTLTLSFDYRLLAQSLPGGGRDGSEYPLIVRVDYIESNGGLIPWYHGFFTVPASGEMRVNAQAHGPVVDGTWHRYDGQLLALSPRPTVIRWIELLGSGWNYAVDVSHVSLAGM